MDWMYKGNNVDKEEYMLGRRVDRSFDGGEAPTPVYNKDSVSNSQHQQDVQVDIQRKLMEDPLVAIKTRELEKRREIPKYSSATKHPERKLSQEEKKEKTKRNKRQRSSGRAASAPPSEASTCHILQKLKHLEHLRRIVKLKKLYDFLTERELDTTGIDTPELRSLYKKKKKGKGKEGGAKDKGKGSRKENGRGDKCRHLSRSSDRKFRYDARGREKKCDSGDRHSAKQRFVSDRTRKCVEEETSRSREQIKMENKKKRDHKDYADDEHKKMSTDSKRHKDEVKHKTKKDRSKEVKESEISSPDTMRKTQVCDSREYSKGRKHTKRGYDDTRGSSSSDNDVQNEVTHRTKHSLEKEQIIRIDSSSEEEGDKGRYIHEKKEHGAKCIEIVYETDSTPEKHESPIKKHDLQEKCKSKDRKKHKHYRKREPSSEAESDSHESEGVSKRTREIEDKGKFKEKRFYERADSSERKFTKGSEIEVRRRDDGTKHSRKRESSSEMGSSYEDHSTRSRHRHHDEDVSKKTHKMEGKYRKKHFYERSDSSERKSIKGSEIEVRRRDGGTKHSKKRDPSSEVESDSNDDSMKRRHRHREDEGVRKRTHEIEDKGKFKEKRFYERDDSSERKFIKVSEIEVRRRDNGTKHSRKREPSSEVERSYDDHSTRSRHRHHDEDVGKKTHKMEDKYRKKHFHGRRDSSERKFGKGSEIEIRRRDDGTKHSRKREPSSEVESVYKDDRTRSRHRHRRHDEDVSKMTRKVEDKRKSRKKRLYERSDSSEKESIEGSEIEFHRRDSGTKHSRKREPSSEVESSHEDHSARSRHRHRRHDEDERKRTRKMEDKSKLRKKRLSERSDSSERKNIEGSKIEVRGRDGGIKHTRKRKQSSEMESSYEDQSTRSRHRHHDDDVSKRTHKVEDKCKSRKKRLYERSDSSGKKSIEDSEIEIRSRSSDTKHSRKREQSSETESNYEDHSTRSRHKHHDEDVSKRTHKIGDKRNYRKQRVYERSDSSEEKSVESSETEVCGKSGRHSPKGREKYKLRKKEENRGEANKGSDEEENTEGTSNKRGDHSENRSKISYSQKKGIIKVVDSTVQTHSPKVSGDRKGRSSEDFKAENVSKKDEGVASSRVISSKEESVQKKERQSYEKQGVLHLQERNSQKKESSLHDENKDEKTASRQSETESNHSLKKSEEVDSSKQEHKEGQNEEEDVLSIDEETLETWRLVCSPPELFEKEVKNSSNVNDSSDEKEAKKDKQRKTLGSSSDSERSHEGRTDKFRTYRKRLSESPEEYRCRERSRKIATSFRIRRGFTKPASDNDSKDEKHKKKITTKQKIGKRGKLEEGSSSISGPETSQDVSTMDDETKERLRNKMMREAKKRVKDRMKNLELFKELEKREEQEQANEPFDEDFANKQFSEAIEHETVENRIKSKVGQIQKSSSDMDKSFVQR